MVSAGGDTVRLVAYRVLALGAKVVFACQLLRLRTERRLAAFGRSAARPRVIATACWSFPIYSQSFVYQELTQLIKAGFELRFLYSHLNRRDPFPSQFRPLWHARRRLLLHRAVCEQSYRYFERRAPERLDALMTLLGNASGLPPLALRAHPHVAQAFAFARMVEAYRPAYLHSYFFYEGTLFALVASLLLDIPRGVSCYADHMLDDYPLKMVATHLGQCQIVIATSDRIRSELLALGPATSPGRILVKPNGINAAAFPLVDRAHAAGTEPCRVVSLCRLEPKKGLQYLVEAVRLLADRGVPVDVNVLGGVDGSRASRVYSHDLARTIRALDLGGVVHLRGRQSEDEINSWFARAHVFVAPFIETDTGDKDGLPTALLEAMASGLAVVATDAGSIPEVVEHDRNGVIVAQRDPAALAEAIASLAADPSRRARLGRAAASRVRQWFDADAGERVFHWRLRELLGGHSGGSGDTERRSARPGAGARD